MSGTTDQLIGVVNAALKDPAEAKKLLDIAVDKQISTLKELASPEIVAPIERNIRKDAEDIMGVLQALKLLRTIPAVTLELITGFGEVWSAQTLNGYLQAKGVPCDWIDAREILIVQSTLVGLGEKGSAATAGVNPLWEETSLRMQRWWLDRAAKLGLHGLDYGRTAPVITVTGFVASTADGAPTTLKRSGSDFSATIFARLLNAARVTMWKNTDGVFTADPRRVPEAFTIASLKYDEAMELAYFGAQVLHPSAMVPCIDASIPVYVRNIFNPAFEGTVIQGRSRTLAEGDALGGSITAKGIRSRDVAVPIKGITSIDKVALVNLEGASIIGVPGVARRFMGAMSERAVNVIMITQASSEHSICVAVPEEQGELAMEAVKAAFELELARSTVNSVSLLKGLSIIAIVGEGMAFTPGVSATFLRALASSGCNVRAIAQGSSERQVSVVVNRDDTTRGLRAVHQAFTLSGTVISVAVVGASGHVGSQLIAQIQSQRLALRDRGLELRVVAAGDKERMALDERGLTGDVAELVARGQAFSLDGLTTALQNDINPIRVVVDCTASDEVVSYYERWLTKGISVVTPNKKGGAGPMDRYARCRAALRKTSAQWLYECSVGAALPVINTIQDMLQTGDQIRQIEGVFSGTLSYLFNTMAPDTPFSAAVQQAKDRGFTEPDPRDDLSGLDVARKMVILARELGLSLELADIPVESLVPEPLRDWTYAGPAGGLADAFIKELAQHDGAMAARVTDATKAGKVLRYVGVVDVAARAARVELRAYAVSSPLGGLSFNDNLISISSDRYTPQPLVIQGPGAGPALTASGVFADILRLSRA
jgi:bifunctional aspartokinase / homoserine dehydrogenase 1